LAGIFGSSAPTATGGPNSACPSMPHLSQKQIGCGPDDRENNAEATEPMCKLTNFQTSSFKMNLIKYHKILHKLHQPMLQAAHHLNDTLHLGMRESEKVYS
jgi:hypothetical protein